MKLTNSVLMTVVLMSLLHAFAGQSDERMWMSNPGGEKGFLKARFGRYDFKSDIRANADTIEQYAESLYNSGLGELTTIGYAAYMKMERGVEYYFRGRVDDYFSVKVGAKMVVPPDSKECRAHDGKFIPDRSGWYPIEIRVVNDFSAGGAGYHTKRFGYIFGVVWKKAGDNDWRQFKVDDDDLFYTGKQSPALAKTLSKDTRPVDADADAVTNEDQLQIPFEEKDSETESANLFVKPVAVPDTAQATKAVKIMNELVEEDVKAMNAGKLDKQKFAMKLIEDSKLSDNVAVKFVLFRNSFNLLLNVGDVVTAQKLFDAVYVKFGGRFASAMANFSRDTLKKMANTPKHAAAAKPLLALVEEAEESCKACDEAAKELGKRPSDQKARMRLAINAIKISDWGLALKTYAKNDDDKGRICSWELMDPKSRTADYTAEKIGDYWWGFADGKDERRLLFKSTTRHAAYWYRKALAEGGMSELKKKLVEKRLASISRTGKLKAKTADQTGGGKPKCYKCKGQGTVQVFRLEPCAECNGKGVIKTGSRSGSDCAACGRRGRVSVERDVECPVCHGKGKL